MLWIRFLLLKIVSKVSSLLCIFWKAKRIRCSCFVSLQRYNCNLCIEKNELLTALRAWLCYSLSLMPVGLRAEFISRISGYRKITVGNEYVSNKYGVSMELWGKKTNKYILHILPWMQINDSLCCKKGERNTIENASQGLKSDIMHSMCSCPLVWGAKKSVLFLIANFCTMGT